MVQDENPVAGRVDVDLDALRTQLEGSGFRVRSLNFSGEGLVAYVEEGAQ